ncbi:MAG: DUF3795 domain-containing protein [Chloroflexota bacterium]|nr:DUF3795 domain-containing protein [Chloroflexota bacterium]
MTDTTLAGACGLYCGACPIYCMYKDRNTERLEQAAREVFHCQPDDIRCEGCRGPLDHHWSPECRFLACTRECGITFCHECADFPCDDLSAFNADHRDIPLSDSRRLAEVGVEAWLAEQEARYRCSASGKPVDIYSEACRACGSELPRR